MKIALLIPELTRHDAVSNDARGMAAALRRAGHDVALFAQDARGIDDEVHAPKSLPGWLDSPDAVLVYHYCVGWDFALDLMTRTRARRVVRYHNITPPEFYVGWSSGHVAACEHGRAQLDAFAALDCDLYLADSPYNLEDFTSRGIDAHACAVLPPFHEVEQLQSLTADPRRIPEASPLLLMVGRLAPNKGFLDLVDALAACVDAGAGDPHLLLVGKLDPQLAGYGEALRKRIAACGLESRVTALADANGAELRAAFEHATALLMPSRHEGFCVPLVEAMALGTPIVALGSSAIPWTVGDAGLIWDVADPALFAASIARLDADAELRAHLLARGRQRYATTFAPVVLERGLHAAMQRVLAA
jgi:glycosyltransferase involved in cell wall biosynthesis